MRTASNMDSFRILPPQYCNNKFLLVNIKRIDGVEVDIAFRNMVKKKLPFDASKIRETKLNFIAKVRLKNRQQVKVGKRVTPERVVEIMAAWQNKSYLH